ncbi:MAG: carboxypeptidase-like regulatory domain-containing protein [Isosphaerales bacterium]
MSVLRAITGSCEPISRRMAAGALIAASAFIAVAIPVLVLLSLASGAGSQSNETWRAHHKACHHIPEEVYHRDRFRAIRGRVTDADGSTIAQALVRCVKLESLVELAKADPPAPSTWTLPIEAETRTDERGQYELPHLPVGGRTLFYSAPGRDLAPAVKDLVVVQDGLGAQLDVTLARFAKLTVRLKTPAKTPMRLYLIPQRWWPSLETASVPPASRSVEFRRVGGPFRKGLIATAGPDDASPLKIIGRYDLDRSAEVVLSGNEMPVLRYDLPEAAGLEPWRFEPSTEERLFYAAMSPVPLFWREAPFGWPSWLTPPAFLVHTPPPSRVHQTGHGHRPWLCATPIPAGAGRVADGRSPAGMDQRSLGV